MLPRGAVTARHRESLVETKAESSPRTEAQQLGQWLQLLAQKSRSSRAGRRTNFGDLNETIKHIYRSQCQPQVKMYIDCQNISKTEFEKEFEEDNHLISTMDTRHCGHT